MRGLCGHSTLAADVALLLQRARSVHTFGMAFPIEIALLDADHVVRKILLVPPHRLVLPRPGIRHVLECAPGTDLRPGDRLRVIPARPRGRRAAAILPGAAPGPGAGCGTDRAPIV